MTIALTEARLDEGIVLEVTGRIDSVTAESFDKTMTGLLDEMPRSLVLDFANVEFLSSAGIRVLMLAARRTRASGIRLALCSLRGNINQIFVISGIVPIFSIHADRAAALSSLH